MCADSRETCNSLVIAIPLDSIQCPYRANEPKICLVWFVWFYGILTFVGYLMPNPFLCK